MGFLLSICLQKYSGHVSLWQRIPVRKLFQIVVYSFGWFGTKKRRVFFFEAREKPMIFDQLDWLKNSEKNWTVHTFEVLLRCQIFVGLFGFLSVLPSFFWSLFVQQQTKTCHKKRFWKDFFKELTVCKRSLLEYLTDRIIFNPGFLFEASKHFHDQLLVNSPWRLPQNRPYFTGWCKIMISTRNSWRFFVAFEAPGVSSNILRFCCHIFFEGVK